MPSNLLESNIVVVDDEPANVELLRALLERWGFTSVRTTTDSSKVVQLCSESEPDLLLLDLRMPAPDGFEVMSLLLPWTLSTTPFPILVLSADVSPETKRRALAGGAKDFLTKPFDPDEVRLRVMNLLQTRRLQHDLRAHGAALEARVRERTDELRGARLELLQRLALAAEFRDDETGEHTQRVGRTARLVAEQLQLPRTEAERLELAAPLHDIGKIGIPDRILLKPGRLTPEEWSVMQRHVEIGARLLAGSDSPILQMAETIARTHHERWDGNGYVEGTAGDAIPLAGRIVAVADVFDALTHARPYKELWPVDRALEEIWSQSGRQFDPSVVEAFLALDHNDLLEPPRNGAMSSSASLLQQLTASAAVGDPAPRETDAAPRVSPAPASPVSAVAVAPAPAPGGPTLTLREAADALAVSPNTLRRWGERGRIQVERTAGGHRRFPVSEIERLNAEGSGSRPSVRLVNPPSHPLISLAELLTDEVSDLEEQAARAVYEDRRAGWFASDAAEDLLKNWVKTLCSACLNGDYDAALDATSKLMRQAQLGGASLLERHTYVERFGELTLRRLAAQPHIQRPELAAGRRLFASLRQSLLEEAAAAA